jgi:beta-lactam-binding protein with PASTA domain
MNPPREPQGGPGHPHPTLDAGQTWANPIGTMQITVDSISAAGANVTISSSFVPPVLKTVPNVLGMGTAAAIDEIRAAGLALGTIGSRFNPDCEELGLVVAQTPATGTQLTAGSRVDIVEAVKPRKGCPIIH